MATENRYNNFMTEVGKNNVNLESGVFKVVLVNGYTYSAAHTSFTSDIEGSELSTGNGYTAGGEEITNISWGYDSGNGRTVFDGDNISWTATGGDLGPSTGAVIITGDQPVMYIDFEGPQTAVEGAQFIIRFSDTGIILFNDPA